MTKEFKEKATRLGKIMNSKSKMNVPLVRCILECFEIVFDEEDLDYMLMMKDGFYTKEQLSDLWGLSGEEFQRIFSKIRDKGGIWQSRKDGTYDVTPIFPGWIELYASGPLNDNRKRLISKFAEFEDLLKSLNVAPIRAYMNRVNTRNMEREEGRMSSIVSRGVKKIEINKPVEAEQTVFIKGEVLPLLERHKDNIAVMNCFCRTMKMLEGHECDYNMPIESCVVVGRMAKQLEESGIARHLSYEEAVGLIEELESKGCIHTLYHYGTDSAREEIVLCNCCTDCCFLYSSYREGALSQLMIKAYYRPQVIEGAKCIGCNKCNHYCPTDATWFDKKKSQLMYDISKCIGCGQCVTQCPVSYRTMVPDERNVFVKTGKKLV